MMVMILDKNSVCELMYLMRDAVEANNLPVAIFISRQINEMLLQMASDKEDITCHLDCKAVEAGESS